MNHDFHPVPSPASRIFLPLRHLLVFIIPLALGMFAAKSPAQSANLFWQKQNIYQIITDRFFDGDTNNDNAEGTYAPSGNGGSSVHGGDFIGIEQKLDYLKSLGATAIWISPIVLNTEGQFHGYSAWNFYEVAPHWGSISNLQHMVQAAHARGLLVIDDIVLNHGGDLVKSSKTAYNYPTGYTLSYVNSAKTYPAPFNLSTANPSLTNIFHNYGNIADYSDYTQVVLGWLDGLNDFRTETTYVRTNMAAIYEYWINQIGFDGFRVDSALEVDQGCWQSFCPAIHAYAATNGNTNFFMFCEVDNSSEAVVAPFTGTKDGGPFEFDSAIDYPLYDNALQSVFATASGAPSLIQTHYNSVNSFYDPASQMQLVNFLDNHDNPRFLSTSESDGNTNMLEVALAFLYTSPGIPCLYYGTEQGFDGTTDPNNREDMFAGEFKDGPGGVVSQLSSPGVDNFNMTHPLFQWVARLNNFRRLYPALSLGSYVNQAASSSGPGLFAYSRILGPQEVLVVFNTAATSQVLPACTLTYPAGTVLVNLLNTNETYTLGPASQTPAITVPSATAKLFIAQSLWQPLDPAVVSNSPAHWATNVPSWSPIVLQFSGPMNTNSVQTAFGTTPPLSGSFTWSSVNALNDTMTFTPAGAGYPSTAQITVVLTNSAFAAVSGNTLPGSYSLSFAAAAGPAVSLTAPAQGTNVSPGASIALAASATGGVVTNVALFANATLLAQLAGTPYSFTWTNVPAGDYALSAVALFAGGYAVTSSVVNVTAAANVGVTHAYDVETNYSSWSNGQDYGSGFNAWSLAGAGQYNGFILTASGTIDTAGKSWALYANGTGTPYAYACRGFSNPLTPAEVFSVQFANPTIATPGSMGFCLGNSNTASLGITGSATAPAPIVTNNATRFAFYVAGGQSDYTIWDANGASDSGVPVGYKGLTLQFSLLTANTYVLMVKSADGSGTLATWSGTLAGTAGSAIQMFSAFNAETGSGQDDFFNTLQIVSPGAPVVSIATPANNAGFTPGGSLTLTANAAEPNGFTITNVAYYADAAPIGNAAAYPYALVWPNVAAGSHALTAVATDLLGNSATSSVVNISAGQNSAFISSPATAGLVIPLGNNTVYLIQVCFTASLDTTNTSLFALTINGVLQPPSSYLLPAAGSVTGCPGFSSLLYDWTANSPGTATGSNVIQVVYSNSSSGLVLSNSVTVIVPPLPVISAAGLAGATPSVAWSSVPGVNYTVLATTNLSQPFTPVSGVIPAAGLTTSYADPSNSPSAPQKFYEIEVVP